LNLTPENLRHREEDGRRIMTRRPRSNLIVACLVLGALLSADWVAVSHGDDDPGCDAQSFALAQAGRGVTVGPPAGGSAPEHCLICHWLRSLRSLSAGDVSVAMAIAPTGAVRVVPACRARRSALFHVSSRAPPA
jgi:hypothetical protein